MSYLENQFLSFWNYYCPDILLEREVKIFPKRRYRFDFCHPVAKVAIEINGQIHHKGGHSSGMGLLRDYEKLNLAITEDWVVFQLSGEMITQEWMERISATINKRSKVLSDNLVAL